VISEDIKATVVYTASPILTKDHTTLTISANDQNVFSIRPVADGQEHSFSFSIPAAILRTAKFLLLRFDGYLRLTTNPCEEPNNRGQWLSIRKRRDLALVGDESRSVPSLENLTNELIVQHALGATPPLTFVLPDKWNSGELTTLALVAARLGHNIGGKL